MCKALVTTISVLIAMTLQTGPRLMAQDGRVQRFDRVAAVLSTLPKDRKLCTAFFIAHHDRVLMVAAKHASLETNQSTEIVLPSKGKPQLFRLVETTKVVGANPWRVHKDADLAVCELDLSKMTEPASTQLKSMCIELERIERVPPKRSTRLECIGFALGLGVESDQISPLAMTCFVASDVLKFDGSWGKESVYYAAPAVGAGTSGGLVTLHAEDPDECVVVGICTGFNGDESGAKLARIVPTSVLIAFIESEVE
jgi:hypothetical protein